MKVSVNWMKQFGGQGLDAPVDELVERIGAQLGAVEEVEDLTQKYRGIVIAKVVKCEDHPNADRLHVCTIDDGGITPDVKRDESGHVQVVCGAPNVREGLLVAWLPPGATVPESVGKDPFVLQARELRGVVSNGMLASPRELALSDEHEGILEIDASEWSPNQAEIKPGADFAKVFGLDDQIIDIENKMFTHRPDCFGQLGVAREIAGISQQQFVSPKWYSETPVLPMGEGLELQVANEVPSMVPRFVAVAIKNVTIKPSPLWLQCALVRVGAKPINNVVDLTNYIMLLTAQPTHAYDYDKLRGKTLMARMAKPDETVTLINHKTYTLNPSDIVIADAEGAVGLAGIMGGGDSEVSDATKNIVLECANFDMYNLRRSSMRHGIFTDALTRFNKGQSPLQNSYILHLLMQSLFDVAGGEVASQVFDINQAEGRAWVHPPVPVTTEFINTRLGFNLSAEEMAKLLQNVEFTVVIEDGKLTVTAPFWRTDIETREDVVEEVGRLYGFDKLPLELPKRSVTPVQKDVSLELKSSIRHQLASAGANEVLTYSFVHGELLDKVGQDKSKAFSLSNALSPDLEYYRLSLTPSLLANVHANIRAGHEQFALFELNKVHFMGEWDKDEPEVPNEDNHVAFVIAANDKHVGGGSAYYEARNYLQVISNTLAAELIPLQEFNLNTDEWGQQLVAPYEPARTAVVVRDGAIWGVIGEFKASVTRALKLPKHVAGFEVHMDLINLPEHGYNPLSKFPAVWQDVTLKVSSSQPYAELRRVVNAALGANAPANTHIELGDVGVYQAKDDEGHKNVTFRITVTPLNRTLTDKEVAKVTDAIAQEATNQLGAERV